jgi:hypothetical protein
MYKVQLKSDFDEAYDKFFIIEGKVFERMTSQEPDKIEQLKKLKSLGYTVPLSGTVLEVAENADNLIVYTDITSHDGKDKILIKAEDALEKYPNNFCSKYIECSQQITTSYKLLQIGKRQFIIRYSSDHEWISNKGRYAIDILAESPVKQYIEAINNPIWSIDYICDINNHDSPVAVDLNYSPKFHELELNFLISNKEIAKEIYDALNHFN